MELPKIGDKVYIIGKSFYRIGQVEKVLIDLEDIRFTILWIINAGRYGAILCRRSDFQSYSNIFTMANGVIVTFDEQEFVKQLNLICKD